MRPDSAQAGAVEPIFLAGPTAVGKSAVALLIAGHTGGEIISVDSMQVYRGLDIGTAKPSLNDRRDTPHHLIDVAGLSESFDAARFAALAAEAFENIRARRRVPIFCGGTGLYFKAFLEGLGSAPKSDPAVRHALEQMPMEALLDELERSDPETFQAIDRRNPRRVVRAVEIIRLTGRPAAQSRSARTREPLRPKLFFGLSRPAEELRRRIDGRVDEMFRRGLIDETRRAMEQGLEENRTAMQAIGYRQMVEHLRGERPLAETIELIKTRTRQFAKRQLTWFRRQAEVQWLPDAETPEETARQIVAIHARSAA